MPNRQRQGIALLTGADDDSSPQLANAADSTATDGTETSGQLLRRLDAHLGGHDEEWLKRLIFRHPKVIPRADPDDDVFFPLVPLAREVHTRAGDIDMLFVSPSGYVTLLEAKLWRNAESRREVLAQVLDYARELANWTHGDLDAHIRRASIPARDGTFAALAAAGADLGDEVDFASRVTRNLQRGRFQLVIVGDRVQPAVEALAGFLHRFTPLPYRLSLVELETYVLPDGRNLLVPATVARTVEVERAVVRVEAATTGASERLTPQASVEPATTHTASAPASSAARSPERRVRLTEEEFFEALAANCPPNAVETARKLLAVTETSEATSVVWTPANAIVRLAIPRPDGADQPLNVFSIGVAGTVHIEGLARPLQAAGLSTQPAENYVSDTAGLVGVDVDPRRGGTARWPRWARNIGLSAMVPVTDAFALRAEQFVEGVLQEARAHP